MARTHRPYTPGGVFHLATRTIRKVKWFKDEATCERIIVLLRECIPLSDAQVMAFAIMPTHLHLLVRQGSEPLSRLMQPLLSRIARVTGRKNKHKGYVFERRFRHREVLTAAHFRTAIWYIHRNPVKAKLCAEECDHPWSSWYAYTNVGNAPAESLTIPQLVVPVELFAPKPDLDFDALQKAYLDYHAYRNSCLVDDLAQRPLRPITRAGDDYWVREFCNRDPRTLQNPAANRADLCDIARRILKKETPGITIDELRVRRGGPVLVAVRHAIIMRARRAGYRNVDVARYLHISEAVVSRVAQQAFVPKK